jgi:fucokinase
MHSTPGAWQYLIITAANEPQAAAFDLQIQSRRRDGRLAGVREVFVLPDAGGRRIGSGGSTLLCLAEVLRREGVAESVPADPEIAETILRRLRILIVHAGGDSRRLPAYSPCGKIFVPLPGDTSRGPTPTIFDRLIPAFLALPETAPGAGQVVVASGDALLLFDSAGIDLSREGITALGSRVSPEEAARHGVFCPNPDGTVRCYLQKPGVDEQAKMGAIGQDGRSVLDIGVMSMDGRAGAVLLRAFGTASARETIAAHGIDLYREICCALGTEATFPHYLASARSSGSKVEEPVLAELFDILRPIPLNLQALDRCGFLHFGTTRQLIDSGLDLVTRERGAAPANGMLTMTSEVAIGAGIVGTDCWVEGCRLHAPLILQRRNVVVGIDVREPLELPEGACLDVAPGFDRQGRKVWFVRYYGIEDTFKQGVRKGATFCGRPLADWLQRVGAGSACVWDAGIPEEEQTLWNARVFPAEEEHEAYPRWRWMLHVEHATPEQKRMFLEADRYSSAEIAVRVDQSAFHARREAIASRNAGAGQACA